MTLHRIVVALDGRTRSDDLEAAAALAGGVGAELFGLFIEDLDLLRFASLPFAREIGLSPALRRSLDVASLERDLRERAARAERAIAGTAGRAAVRWSFRVTRGFVAAELLAAAAEALAASARAELRLLLLGDGDSPAASWAEEARLRMSQGGAATRLQLVHAANLAELAAALHGGAPGVLVLRAGQSVLSHQGLRDLLQQTAVPVLVLPARS